MHVLVAPDDASESFVVNTFEGGTVVHLDVPPLQDFSPLEGLSLAARMLRNLRMIYEEEKDPVRLLGVVERTLLVAEQDVEMNAVPEDERVQCRAAVEFCLSTLQDRERCDECLGLPRAGRWEAIEGRWEAIEGRWEAIERRWEVIKGRWEVIEGRWDAI
jgi:hypothetical protein